MTKTFNFFNECLYKYDQEVYDWITDLFDTLSLSAVVNKKFFVVHGGLSPDLKELNQINHLDRFKEIPKFGMFCDLLWSDPTSNDKGFLEKDFDINQEWKCSYVFGAHAVKWFLKKNKLLTIIRAHEV